MYETLSAVQAQTSNIEQQTNANALGQPAPPPNIQGLNVMGQNGHFNIKITDQSNVYRGVKYFVEHSADAHFSNPQIIDLGASRNHSVFLGNTTRYWRAYSSYGPSSSSNPVYHGGQTPVAVSGGGSVGAPFFQESESSGTGFRGQSHSSGQGPTPFRSDNGAPPVR